MRGGEPSVLQTPPRPNQGGNPPRTPLFNTRLVKTETPPALLYCTVVQYCSSYWWAMVVRVLVLYSRNKIITRGDPPLGPPYLYHTPAYLYWSLFIFQFPYLVRVSIKKFARASPYFVR